MNSELVDESTWEEWPRCPQCQQLRLATCPTCEIAARDFPLADLIAEAPGLVQIEGDKQTQWEILLMCPACDEAFAPSFYQLCENCGHDFEDGKPVAGAGGSDGLPREQLPMRAIVVILILIGLGAASLLYFSLILGE